MNSNPSLGQLSTFSGVSNLLTMSLFGGFLTKDNMTTKNIIMMGIILITFGWVSGRVRAIFGWILDYIKRKAFFSITVESKDEVFHWLVEWLSKTKYAETYSDLCVSSSWGSGFVGGRGKRKKFFDLDKKKRPQIAYVPAFGTHLIYINRRVLWITRRGSTKNKMMIQGNGLYPGMMNGNMSKFDNEELKISTFIGFKKGGEKFLKELIVNCMEKNYSEKEKSTYIYTNRGMTWQRSSVKKKRKVESVILPEGMISKIENDISSFIKSSDWYHKTGVPFRRGYLFHGAPGTGKSSLCLALAGKLGMSVAILSLNGSSLNDYSLSLLLDNAPDNTLVLIEDIDASLDKKKQENIGGSRGHWGTNNNGVTYSGLLNALDGLNSGEGRIVFLTTNYHEKLPRNLIRPGRVDLKIKFNLATKYQIKNMFLKFFPKETDIANQLAQLIPSQFVSCAELQGFFLEYRSNPTQIIDKVDLFIKQIKEERIIQEKEDNEKMNQEKNAEKNQTNNKSC